MAGSLKLDEKTAAGLERFNKQVIADANVIIMHTFPAKYNTVTVHSELQELINQSTTPSSPFHLSHASYITDATVYPPPTSSPAKDEPESKKRKISAEGSTNGAYGLNDSLHATYPNLVHANKHMRKVHETVKKECEELAMLFDKVKLWINLTMPKIEDGDNFGVQIQEEVLNELHRSQESAVSMRDSARTDHLNRAKICSKLIKYPHIEDYTYALKEHDERQLYLARQHLYDLRNVYAVITDIIHKNLTKLRTPKGNNSIGLY
ncbi:proteasome activator pa28 REG alpha/beta subunit [Amylostereum chailletii]|nr:proteasome activator pa28 REG alpha/beta subunit [Amylostereum chailletii]